MKTLWHTKSRAVNSGLRHHESMSMRVGDHRISLKPRVDKGSRGLPAKETRFNYNATTPSAPYPKLPAIICVSVVATLYFVYLTVHSGNRLGKRVGQNLLSMSSAYENCPGAEQCMEDESWYCCSHPACNLSRQCADKSLRSCACPVADPAKSGRDTEFDHHPVATSGQLYVIVTILKALLRIVCMYLELNALTSAVHCRTPW